jgi:xylulokinase
MEGVAFASARHLKVMEAAAGTRLERVVASGGGAKTALWLKIKASLYGIPVVVPEEAECGLVGCAVMAGVATGRFRDVEEAVSALVRHTTEIAPDPAWAERYARMQPIFDRLYRGAQDFYDDLDRLAAD